MSDRKPNPDLESRIRERLSKVEFRKLTSLQPHCFDSISSTQDYFKDELRSSTTEGDFALALVQTKGRGRGGRKWNSDLGGMWVSLVLSPSKPEVVDRIVLIASDAIKETLEKKYGLCNCSIKRPNDVYCNGKKIAGVLADALIQGTKSMVCLGVGVNLNNDPTQNGELKHIATSYVNETGRTVDIEEFLVSLLSILDTKYDALLHSSIAD